MLPIANASWCAELEPSALIRDLARPTSSTTPFVEVRYSTLLEAPTVVSGQLSYVDAQTLERQVLKPYLERTTIRGESVRVERDGEPVRTFALRRAPELGTMLKSFSALLAGDASALQRDFELAARGQNEAWVLELTPRDRRARSRVQTLLVSGSHDQPRCILIRSPHAANTFMLIGDATAFDATELEEQRLREHCGFDGS